MPSHPNPTSPARSVDERRGEEGFLLVGVLVMVFLILLALSVAAPRMARELRREQEVEAMHRANQYVRAIQLFYRKNGTYPGSISMLEKSNNIRYLREQYVDPLTGKANWRLIHLGEAKTTVKGFFGKPLTGLAGAGSLGSLSDSASQGIGSNSSTTSSTGFGGTTSGSSSTGPGTSTGIGSTGFSLGSNTSSTSPTGTTTGGTGSGTTTSNSTGFSQDATTFQGSGAPIMGVGIADKTGTSIITVNEQTTYPTWEFIYDPRIEQLKAKTSIFGGSPATNSATTFGSATNGANGTSSTPGFGSTTSGTTTNGTTGTSGASGNTGTSGTNSNSGFGSSSGFGFGSSPNPTSPQTNPQ